MPDPDALRELHRLAGRLDDRRTGLAISEMHCKSCEEEESRIDQLLTEEGFRGQTAPDTAAAKRREVVERARAAREIRDQAKAFVVAGERLCDEKAREIAQANVDAAYEERRRYEGEIEALHEREASLNVALMVCDEMAESWSYAGTRRLKLQALFSESARRTLETRALQRQAKREFKPETAEEQSQRVVDDVLAVRAVDEGREVPAYVRLPMGDDGGPVRIG